MCKKELDLHQNNDKVDEKEEKGLLLAELFFLLNEDILN